MRIANIHGWLDKSYLAATEKYFNMYFQHKGHLLLTDVMDAIGTTDPRTSDKEMLGWVTEDEIPHIHLEIDKENPHSVLVTPDPYPILCHSTYILTYEEYDIVDECILQYGLLGAFPSKEMATDYLRHYVKVHEIDVDYHEIEEDVQTSTIIAATSDKDVFFYIVKLNIGEGCVHRIA